MQLLREALMPLVNGHVYPTAIPVREKFPDDYIVLTIVDERPDLYAGDTDEGSSVSIRAAWYSRHGNAGHGEQMRKAARAAGFMVLSGSAAYAETGKADIYYQEFWIESEE